MDTKILPIEMISVVSGRTVFGTALHEAQAKVNNAIDGDVEPRVKILTYAKKNGFYDSLMAASKAYSHYILSHLPIRNPHETFIAAQDIAQRFGLSTLNFA